MIIINIEADLLDGIAGAILLILVYIAEILFIACLVKYLFFN